MGLYQSNDPPDSGDERINILVRKRASHLCEALLKLLYVIGAKSFYTQGDIRNLEGR